MKRFEQRQLREAYAHAEAGGQALHVCEMEPFVTNHTPRCFRESDQFAHLFDQDLHRLIRTARWLGVKRIVVERRGTLSQHVDLCGGPLKKAIAKAANETKQDRSAHVLADPTLPEVQEELAL